jgi:hypothetical protein
MDCRRSRCLNETYLSSLGCFDRDYSWGATPHGKCVEGPKALENVGKLMAPGGALFVAIYNDQGTSGLYELIVY